MATATSMSRAKSLVLAAESAAPSAGAHGGVVSYGMQNEGRQDSDAMCGEEPHILCSALTQEATHGRAVQRRVGLLAVLGRALLQVSNHGSQRLGVALLADSHVQHLSGHAGVQLGRVLEASWRQHGGRRRHGMVRRGDGAKTARPAAKRLGRDCRGVGAACRGAWPAAGDGAGPRRTG